MTKIFKINFTILKKAIYFQNQSQKAQRPEKHEFLIKHRYASGDISILRNSRKILCVCVFFRTKEWEVFLTTQSNAVATTAWRLSP